MKSLIKKVVYCSDNPLLSFGGKRNVSGNFVMLNLIQHLLYPFVMLNSFQYLRNHLNQ